MRELFESTIERLLGDLATSEYVLGCEGGTWPAELWAAVEESGFTLAAIPEPLGGADAGWSDLYVLARAAGRFAAPIPLGEALLGNWLLGQVGLEGHGGVLSIAADARLSLRGGTVEGVLHDVPWGRHSEAVVAIAEEDGIPSVVLLARAEAVEQSLGLNVAGEPRDDLHFSSAPVLACAPLPLGIPAEALLLGGALLRSAQIAGASLAYEEVISSNASERSQFGRPIGAFQAIQQQLAVFAEQAVAATIAAEAAFVESDKSLASLTIAVAKVSTAEAASSAASIAHSVHGAIGFTQEYSLHLLSRRLWSWRSEFGSASFWSQRIGQLVSARGGEGYWPLLTEHAGQTLLRIERQMP